MNKNDDNRQRLNRCRCLYLEGHGSGENDLDLVIDVVEAAIDTTAVQPGAGNAIDMIMGPGYLIEPGPDSLRFRITFRRYVAFSILNESFAEPEKMQTSCEPLQSFNDSHFLDYVSQSTFATSAHPGSFRHFELGCLNHIVNVACEHDPEITLIGER